MKNLKKAVLAVVLCAAVVIGYVCVATAYEVDIRPRAPIDDYDSN